MNYKRFLMFLIPAVVGLMVLAAFMGSRALLTVSTSFMVFGFFFIGLSAPDLLDEWIDSGYSVVVPIAFSVIAVIGTVFQAGSSAPGLLLSFDWCPKSPCMPFLVLVVSFIVGNLANWAGHILNNDEIEILTLK